MGAMVRHQSTSLAGRAPLSVSYDWHLLLLSLVIAMVVSCVAIAFGERMTYARRRTRGVWFLCGSVAIGAGIWSTHITGMLAIRLPVPIRYDGASVGLSLMAAIAASAIALPIVSGPDLSRKRWLGGGILMGSGIAIMHYTGMGAMRLDAETRWSPPAIVLSLLIAIVIALFTIWIVFRLRSCPRKYILDPRCISIGFMMGIAISGLQYTAIAAVTFISTPHIAHRSHILGAAHIAGDAVGTTSLLALLVAVAIALVDRRFSAQEHVLSENRHRFQAVLANAPVILFAIDVTGCITLAQGHGLAVLDRSATSLEGRMFFEIFADVPDLVHQARRVLEGEECSAITTVRDTIFETRWITIRDEDNLITGGIVVATDMTERQHAEQALQHQALHDSLTSLPNRELLNQRLGEALQVAEMNKTSLALILMDLNRFKDVNDTLGHQAGDTLLQQVAGRIESVLREQDVGARLGGDEFAVILPGATVVDATAIVQRILAALATPYIIEGHILDAHGSLGIAVFPDHGIDSRTLLRRADIAMYVAKRAGIPFAIYDERHDRHSTTRLTLESDLRYALETKGLTLHYQPKVDLATGQLRRVEALARWTHPTHGAIPPDQFIPLAEQTGLIEPLTRWVLEAAIRQTKEWHDRGLILGVAVNVSVYTLNDESLPDTVSWLLQRFDVEPAFLTLEVTEGSLMADPQRSREVLTRLAALGVTLSIDDFGIGYSSLGYLMELPVHEVKIDKSFVLGMDESSRSIAIVRSVSELGHNLGLQVVAEGVETEAAWHTLSELGCDVAQGFYVSRALPPDALELWAREAPWAVA